VKANYSARLRKELIDRAECFVANLGLGEHVYRSLGHPPTVLFKPYADHGTKLHDNFHPASYGCIMQSPAWRARLEKSHSQIRALSASDQAGAKELDSCTSSDALLMSVFCDPSVGSNLPLAQLFGFERLPVPEFGFLAELPLLGGGKEPRSTEIDMRLAGKNRMVLVESKLTEKDFTQRCKDHVRRYEGFDAVFDAGRLPEDNGGYDHYQLLRNVLAAHHHNASFCLLCDERRPDLQDAWQQIADAIVLPDVRRRCMAVSWQKVARTVGEDLRKFLAEKYGIGKG
jgi:hypothetical protein